jgi:uncharacterized protein (TIGR02588 family)
MTQTEFDPTRQPDAQRPPRTTAEWVTFGIASSILAGIVGLIIYAWATEGNRPPELMVYQAEAIREANGQFYVPFAVQNQGGETVESVQVLAELRVDDRLTATSEQQIDFLSAGERETGAFIFQQDPRQGKMRLRVGSYTEP